MKDLAEAALNAAQVKGASYADVRLDEHVTQDIIVKNGQLAAVSDDASEGFGVRVIVDGAWGFAGSARLDKAEVHLVVDRAVRIARAGATVRSAPVDLGPPVTSRGHYRTPLEREPFAVPLAEKVDLLLRADAAMGSVKGVTIREGSMEFIRQAKLFASTEGAFIEQELFESGAGIEATATSPDDVQNRSYPNSFGRHQGSAGYEYITALELDRHAGRIAEEAVALLSAPQCPSGVKTLILDASQTALQIHESCGHPTELDRVFGMEAAYAGTSFMTPEKLNHLQYGPPKVTITADALTPTGLGTFGWDDEGVPAQRTFLIKNGLFVGYLTSRETASVLGQQSNGTMRADGWNRIPLIRMTNVNLEAGDSSLEQMIAETKDGVYMETNRSWSIDDKRLNFQFGTQLAYEIIDGKRGRMLKNATYAGITPEFWNSCDAVAGIPELGRDPRIRRVFQHAAALAIDNFVGELGPKLKVQPLVVDAPTPVGLHVDAVPGLGDHLFQRRVARLEVDVRHADQRDAVPAVGAHRAVTCLAQHAGRFPGREISDEEAILDQESSLRRHALVVPAKRAQPRRCQRVGRDRDLGRAVLQMIEFFGRHEARTRVGGLHAEDPVELGRMAAGLVDLERRLAGIENQGPHASGTLRRCQERDGFFADPLAVLVKLERRDVLVAARPLVPAK